jgi:hypothetical protein
MTNDNTWLDQMIEAEPAARDQFKPTDVYKVADGEPSDFNLHYADMAAEPDTAADPFAISQGPS